MIDPVSDEEFPLGTRSGDKRTVMLELFTATWCQGCPYADAAAERLLRVIGPDRVSLIQYHVADELRINESDERRDSYGSPSLPSLCVDGELRSTGANSFDEAYDEYFSLVNESLQNETSVSLALEHHVAGGTVTLNASLDSIAAIPGENLSLRFALFENLVEADSKIYNFTVRAFNETSVDPAALPVDESMTFVVDASWTEENMGVAVFLQSGFAGEIYQSISAMFGDPPTISIADPTDDPISGDYVVEGSSTGTRPLYEVFLRIDEGLWVEAEGSSEWHYSVDTTELSDGSHLIYAMVYDVSGAYSQPDALSVVVKNERSTPSLDVAVLLTVILSLALFLSLRRRRP